MRALVLALAACSAAPAPKAPTPAACPVQAKPLPIACVVVKPPQLGPLLVCEDGDTWCERINVLRKLDHHRRLVTYGDWVVAACDIYEAPSWGEP